MISVCKSYTAIVRPHELGLAWFSLVDLIWGVTICLKRR